jgi:hypothetical protein
VHRWEKSNRNQARRMLTGMGQVKKYDGRDIDHVDGNPLNNNLKNLRVCSIYENRAKGAIKANMRMGNVVNHPLAKKVKM